MPINSINKAVCVVSCVLIPGGGMTALVGGIFLAAHFFPSLLSPTTALYIGPPVLVLGVIIEGVGIALLVIYLKKCKRCRRETHRTEEELLAEERNKAISPMAREKNRLEKYRPKEIRPESDENGFIISDELLLPLLAISGNDRNAWSAQRLVCRHWYHITTQNLDLARSLKLRELHSIDPKGEKGILQFLDEMGLPPMLSMLQINAEALFDNVEQLDSLIFKQDPQEIQRINNKVNKLFKYHLFYRISSNFKFIIKGFLFKLTANEKNGWVILLKLHCMERLAGWKTIYGNDDSIFVDSWIYGKLKGNVVPHVMVPPNWLNELLSAQILAVTPRE